MRRGWQLFVGGVAALGLMAAHGGPIADREAKASPALPRPGYLEPFTDPVFGTRLMRITGDPDTPVPGFGG